MEPKFFKIPVCVGDVTLRVAKGHFATRHSHINYFIDVTRQQSCLQEAEAVAQQLAQRLQANTMVDTILCMDGTRVIGTCLARQLTQEGGLSVNAGKEIYLLRENVSSNGKLILRDNARFMLEGKNVLLLLASITTGSTVGKGMRCVQYYGGSVSGVSAVYSTSMRWRGCRWCPSSTQPIYRITPATLPRTALCAGRAGRWTP